MLLRCPYCRKSADPDQSPVCPHCGCEIDILGRIYSAAHDSLLLSLEALREGRARDAHDYAYEGWGLVHSRETAAAGLLSAILLGDPIEIARWVRRRRATEI